MTMNRPLNIFIYDHSWVFVVIRVFTSICVCMDWDENDEKNENGKDDC